MLLCICHKLNLPGCLLSFKGSSTKNANKFILEGRTTLPICLKIEHAKFWNTLVCRGAQKQCFRSTLGFQSISNREEQGGGGLGSGGVGGGGEEEGGEEEGGGRCSIVIMVNFTDMDSKDSVGAEEVKEELAKARVELGRKRRWRRQRQK